MAAGSPSTGEWSSEVETRPTKAVRTMAAARRIAPKSRSDDAPLRTAHDDDAGSAS
jgi:hypothetical protein